MTWWAAPPSRAGPRRSSSGCGSTPAPNPTPFGGRRGPGSSPVTSTGPGSGLLYAVLLGAVQEGSLGGGDPGGDGGQRLEGGRGRGPADRRGRHRGHPGIDEDGDPG